MTELDSRGISAAIEAGYREANRSHTVDEICRAAVAAYLREAMSEAEAGTVWVPARWVPNEPKSPNAWSLFPKDAPRIATIYKHNTDGEPVWVSWFDGSYNDKIVPNMPTADAARAAVERALGVRGGTTKEGFDAAATEALK